MEYFIFFVGYSHEGFPLEENPGGLTILFS